MNWWQRLCARGRLEEQLDAELRFHIERQVVEKVRAGVPEEEARRLARLEFGTLDWVKEECRDARGAAWLETTARDIQFGWRTLWKSPGFMLAAICTLALGIGANTAMFSVVYAVLLKPLPYAEPERLVSVTCFVPELRARIPSMGLRARDFDAYRRSSSTLDGISALRSQDFNLTGEGDPERLYGARVSANFFSMLGAQPDRGRTFLPEEDQPGRDNAVVLSHELWTGRFGSASDILNRSILLDGKSYVVVGVMPEGFLFPARDQLHATVRFGPRVDIWKPMAFTASDLEHQGNWAYACIARLKPGVSLAQAQQDLTGIAATVPFPDGRMTAQTQMVPLSEVFSGRSRRGLLALLGAVALLLLIACVNLINLFLARANARGRELATRAALGASRWRLVRQLVTESLLVSSLGGAAGTLLAFCGTRLLVSLGPADSPAARSSELSGPVLLFTAVLALVAGVTFGLASAWEATRRETGEGLASRGATAGMRTRRLGRTLVVIEVALSTALLIGAGLLLHSFANVMEVDKGFSVEKVLAADLSLSAKQYPAERASAFYQELVERVGTSPGVLSAGIVTAPPLGGKAGRGEAGPVYFEADKDPAVTVDRPLCAFHSVTQGYFTTLEIPLRAGRLLEDQEPAPATVISAGLARRLWPGESLERVVGRRIKLNYPGAEPVTIVGIVGDVRAETLEQDAPLTAYRPVSQAPFTDVTLLVRTSKAPEAVAAAVRGAVSELDRNLPIASIQTMRQILSASTALRRLQMTLTVGFALLALVLAAAGIYGVISYSVARQTQEIGLRMALGARPGGVLRSVWARGMRPVALGLALGLAAAALLAASIRALLFGVGPLDPISLGGASAILVLAAALACYLPARRASCVDPVVALRTE